MVEVCVSCGSPLKENLCVTCIAEQSKCVLCLKRFEIGDTVLFCRECLYMGHANEMKQWLRVKAICPVCRMEAESGVFEEATLHDRSLQEFVTLRNKLIQEREEIFNQFQFRLPFYDFQSSLVLQIKKHFENNRSFLLVSPPGSGKTIIGLALVRELGKHALILTPNLAVLGSWLERAAMFFDPVDANLKVQHVIGKEKGFLRPMTIMTYQKLNQELRDSRSRKKKKKGKKTRKKQEPSSKTKTRKKDGKKKSKVTPIEKSVTLLERLLEHDIGLVILDEAHRLTQQWGRDVKELLDFLPHTKVLGLTATPPESDDPDFLSIFPKIDADIPRHLLVREGILVPYQDLVHIILPPTRTETELETELEASVNWRPGRSSTDPLKDFEKESLQELEALEDYMNETLDSFSKFLSIVMTKPTEYLKPRERKAINTFFENNPWMLHQLTTTEINTSKRIRMDDEASFALWHMLERVLKEIGTELFHGIKNEVLERNSELQTRREDVLKRIGVSKTQSLDRFVQHFRWLCWNLKWKLLHVLEVLRLEYQLLGEDLRAMIILDQESLPSRFSLPLKGMHGAIGVFESLVRTDPLIDELDPILVTGKTILVDDDLVDRFLTLSERWAEQQRLIVEFFMRSPISKWYAIIGGSGPDWSTDTYTRYVTWLFEQGITKCLVGTRFLLGEGWDSLTLNTLLDLTTIASETTVNQVKGRALRRDPSNPDKVTNIWEFVPHPSLTPHSRDEFTNFVRKHQHYWGIDNKGNIRNGVARIDPRLRPDGLIKDPALINEQSKTRARDRLRAKKLWKVGVKLGQLYYGFNFQFSSIDLRMIKQEDLKEALEFTFKELTKKLQAEVVPWKVVFVSPLDDDSTEDTVVMIGTPVTTSNEVVEVLTNTFLNPTWEEGLVIRLEPPITGLMYRTFKWARLHRKDQSFKGRLARFIHSRTKEKYFTHEIQREQGLFFPHPVPSSTSRMGLHILPEDEIRELLLQKYVSHEIQVFERLMVAERLRPHFNEVSDDHLNKVIIEHFYIDEE